MTSVLPSTTIARSCFATAVPREVQAVEHVPLLEELALGRVDVLPSQRIVVAKLARLEADDPPSRIVEREHQPEREVVVAAGVRETCGLHLLDGEASLPRFRDEPRPARETETERARALLAEPAAREVLPHRCTRLRLPEHPLEVRRRLLEQSGQPLATLACRVLARRRLLVLERDAEPLGEPLDRADEVEVLGLLDEAHDVPALAAAEAVVELADGVDREARRALLVERAAAAVSRARRTTQRGSGRDDVDHVGRGDDRVLARVLDPRHSARAYSGPGEREREPVGHARDVVRDPRRQVALAVGEERRVGDEPLEDRAHDPLGPLVLRHRLRPEVDAIEHERAQREHRLAHVVALDDLTRRLGRLDEIVDERVDPLASRSRRAARSRRPAGRPPRGARSEARRRCRG